MQLQSPKRGTGTRTGHKRLWLRDNTVVDPKSESEFVGEFSKDIWAMREAQFRRAASSKHRGEHVSKHVCEILDP